MKKPSTIGIVLRVAWWPLIGATAYWWNPAGIWFLVAVGMLREGQVFAGAMVMYADRQLAARRKRCILCDPEYRAMHRDRDLLPWPAVGSSQDEGGAA